MFCSKLASKFRILAKDGSDIHGACDMWCKASRSVDIFGAKLDINLYGDSGIVGGARFDRRCDADSALNYTFV